MSVAIVRRRHICPTREAERDAMPMSLNFAGARTVEAYRLRRSQNKVESSRQLFPKEIRREMNRFSG